MWNLIVFLYRTAQNQHSTMCCVDVRLQCFWLGQVRTQAFNFVENGEVSNVLFFDRRMKCFLKWKWNGWRTFWKTAFSLLVKEFTQAEGAERWTCCPWSNRAGIFPCILGVSLGGTKESSVLSRTQGFLGWVAALLEGMKREQSYVSGSRSSHGFIQGTILGNSAQLWPTWHWEDPLINRGAGRSTWHRVGEGILWNLHLQIQV